MRRDLAFSPLVPWEVVAGMGALALVVVALAAWRGLPGWWLRALAGVALIAALAGPALRVAEEEGLSDLVVLAVDASASNRLDGRDARTAGAAAALEEALEDRADVVRVDVADDPGDGGTLLGGALSRAVAELPAGRIAGVIALTDGQVADPLAVPSVDAPFHVLLTGERDDWDRRLVVRGAPAYAILGEEVVLEVEVVDEGPVPEGVAGSAEVAMSVDGAEPVTGLVRPGEVLRLPVVLPHGGRNVIRFETPGLEGETTDRNNAAIVQMTGVRDRLRVLLVSGEPHPGTRTWRNLLKSDSQVDLVHFTILRPPGKEDGVPVDELSLIAFPTRELFLEKVEEFDLIIFDRYQRRGILPDSYLASVADYVREGGAVLVAAGPDFATASSLYYSPLGEVLPGAPTSVVLEEAFRPEVTEIGGRHPVTDGLAPVGEAAWGRWGRLVDVSPVDGQTVMAGPGERPLLQLSRVGEGRVALLASDHAWLWDRGVDGGGPQMELLRRLAHWLMKEPELEEEALTAQAEGQRMVITRRTLREEPPGDVLVTGPDGEVVAVPLEEVSPGVFQGRYDAPELGLYRLEEGGIVAVFGLGPPAPREFERTLATDAVLGAAAEASGGAVRPIEGGLPQVREVRPGRAAFGRGWIGITPREAAVTTGLTITPLGAPWLWLLVAGMLVLGAWLLEGRRT
ncbi:hypothetical protein BCF33_1582 [Hasllibacter halocynthiae]|uniref:Glutamine amidotransferase n=1 Tax=Hasllibacter halocynthiae TaxID=595589 RepID=A0A2T0X1A6_9RHOB|nr:hypothetical protein [Hasllibacter halocynthiae]PRY92728.1 hypothetical protein BCF33_1582 [Hasllibacter halocynthiae]